MSRVGNALAIAGGLCAGVFALAFVAAPRSCEWGLSLYVWSGGIALLLLAVIPFLGAMGGSLRKRFAWSAAFVLSGAGVWLAGLFAANVRILCRLF